MGDTFSSRLLAPQTCDDPSFDLAANRFSGVKTMSVHRKDTENGSNFRKLSNTGVSGPHGALRIIGRDPIPLKLSAWHILE